MAHLEQKVFEVKVENKFNNNFFSRRKLAVCSECGEVIYSPANGLVYKHCYNCGAKFDTPVSAKTIREAKH